MGAKVMGRRDKGPIKARSLWALPWVNTALGSQKRKLSKQR